MKEQNYGIVRESAGRAAIKSIPVPKVPDDYLLVKVVAVALNPTDWTTLDAPGDPGTIVGCDYAGVVVEVGKAVTRKFKEGDRVAGIGHGGNDANPQHGTFARYIIVKGDIQFHINKGVSFEAGSTAGCGLTTIGYALYKVLDVSWPGQSSLDQDTPILIYGGSTATGTLAIQFAKLSGLKVLTTSSPKNHELLRKLGADVVLDYRDPTVGKHLKAASNNKLSLVFDCIATNETAAICAEAIGSAGGKYCNLMDVNCPRTDVESLFFLGYSASGESYIFEGEHYDAQPDFFAHSVKFAELADKLWAEGKFQPHPQRIGKNGFQGVLNEGLQILRDGKHSGEKLVYRVDETEWP